MYQFADNVYVQEAAVRFYGFRVQTRMAAVVLPEERLLLYSPVALTAELSRELAALGKVAFLLSPNKIHNQTLAAYCARYPEAELHVPPGLAERRPGLRISGVLGDAPHAAWRTDLDQALTGGNVFFSEALLFHRRSRTLLVGDLVEHFDQSTASTLGRAAARLFGVGRRPVASPEFRFYTHDAEAAARSFVRAQRWDFERIFLCHGRMITADAKAVFATVVDGVLSAARRRTRLSRWVFRQLAAVQ